MIDFTMLEKFRQARLAAKVAPATINKALRTLQSILQRAVKRGYLKINPFKGNRQALWVKEPEPVPKVVCNEHFQAMLDACPDDRWRAILILANYTGMRRGEILALEWSDIEFDRGMLYVNNKCNRDHVTKSKMNRPVPMSSQVVQALERLRLGMMKSNLVFTNSRGGKIRYNIDRDYEIIAKRAGLVDAEGRPFFTLHDFRVTCCTELQRSGVPMKTAQRLLGHANMSATVRHYSGVEEKDLRDAIKRLESRTA